MKRTIKHDYPLTNDYMFATIMNNPNYCKELLSRILPERKIKSVKVLNDLLVPSYENVDTQHTIVIDVFSKGVRLDVVFEDEDSIYNVEMQCVNESFLRHRARYYSGQLDMEQLLKGQSYSDLKDTFVIFLCTFDPMKDGKSIYAFETYDIKHQLKLDDGRYIIYVNLASKEEGISKELSSLFDYMINNQMEEDDKFLCDIENEISILNREDGEWRRHIMRLEEKIERDIKQAEKLAEERGVERGRTEGMKIGEQQEKLAIAKKLKEQGMVVAQIAEVTALSVSEIEEL